MMIAALHNGERSTERGSTCNCAMKNNEIRAERCSTTNVAMQNKLIFDVPRRRSGLRCRAMGDVWIPVAKDNKIAQSPAGLFPSTSKLYSVAPEVRWECTAHKCIRIASSAKPGSSPQLCSLVRATTNATNIPCNAAYRSPKINRRILFHSCGP
jgi:hypothetical protein